MNLARPSLARQCRYGHRRAIFAYIYKGHKTRVRHL